MSTIDNNNFAKQRECLSTRHAVTGLIKQVPADFVVEEIVGFEFTGTGEHVVVQVKKQDLSTLEVVDAISRVTGSSKKDIGFCGLKDKRAISTQWFSVRVPAQAEAALPSLENERIEILSYDRHCKKLKRGHHFGNHFSIKVRQLGGDMIALADNLQKLRITGVPNYFGPQRFSRNNLRKADALFCGQLKRVSHAERGMVLSSVRSAMFNEVLTHRVRDGTWNKLLVGDAANLNGTNSHFQVREVTEELQNRLTQFDVHPSGPLFGTGRNPVANGVYQLESGVFGQHPTWCEGLSKFGLRLQRRSLRLKVSDLRWEIFNNETLALSFSLRKGGFATSVLSALLDYTGPEVDKSEVN